jgi:enoyl-CoA hydratase/carnithine racemase
MNAADALHIGLATHAIDASGWPKLMDTLAASRWRGDATDRVAIETAIAACGRPTLADSALARHRAVLETEIPELPSSLTDAVARLNRLAGRDEWLDRGLATLRSGCPTSIGIVYEQLRRVAGMALADTFRMELCIATHCARNPDFAEGVRALIIDKDNQPRWRFGTLAALPDDYVQGHFVMPWSRHPLATLGGQ